MHKDPIIVVQYLPGNASRKSQELIKAEVRAHAARISHRARHPQKTQSRTSCLAKTQSRTSCLAKTQSRTLCPARHQQAKATNAPTEKPSTNSRVPLTMMGRGQSDPFNAFPIPIDTTVNMLMTYCRDIELPSIRGGAHNPTRRVHSQDWSHCVNQLTSTCSAYAQLTRIVAAIPLNSLPECSTLVEEASKYRSKAIKLLNKKLVSETALRDEDVVGSIASLLLAELYDDDITAAHFHRKILAHTIQSGTAVVNVRETL